MINFVLKDINITKRPSGYFQPLLVILSNHDISDDT